jgi:hypothetical protein
LDGPATGNAYVCRRYHSARKFLCAVACKIGAAVGKRSFPKEFPYPPHHIVLLLSITDPFGNVTGGLQRAASDYSLVAFGVLLDTDRLLDLSSRVARKKVQRFKDIWFGSETE